MTFRLEYYEPAELGIIVRRSAGILGVEIADDAADQIAARSRGTPRVANRILRRVRDVAQVRHEGVITNEVAAEALELLEVDGHGLERTDRELLRAIVERFDGGPVGLSTLAVALGEEPDTIEDVYEPYLLQLGFIQRTPRGRVVTKLGRAHVGAAKGGRARSSRALDWRLVPRRHGCELEERAVAARVAVAELRLDLVPVHVQQPLLDAVVEPGAAEDELPQPVDERLALHERELLPVADEIAAERAPRLLDAPVRGKLDEIVDLVLVQVVALDEPELDRGGGHALLEVVGVEGEPVAEELDHVVLAGGVVRLDCHWPKDRGGLEDECNEFANALCLFWRGASKVASPSGPLRTLACPMQDSLWTIKPCPQGAAADLAHELEVSETTARVLLRRGYDSVDAAKAFLAGELPGHDPFLLGDMAGAVETIKGAIAAGKRICVHGDYDADGICATALAVLILRSSAPTSNGTCRAASRRATGCSARRSRGSPTRAAGSC